LFYPNCCFRLLGIPYSHKLVTVRTGKYRVLSIGSQSSYIIVTIISGISNSIENSIWLAIRTIGHMPGPLRRSGIFSSTIR